MDTKSIETVCVVGAGFMGVQIGLHCAVHGCTVWLVDLSEKALERARRSNHQELEKRVEGQEMTAEEKETVLGRIHTVTDLEAATTSADLVIEAVPERLETKREVFSRLDQVCSDHTIFATNSSSIRVSALEDATRRPDKLLNMHFFVPVWQRPLVELMRGTATSEDTIEKVSRFARSLELTPLLCLKESTGFLFNRVWRAIKKECLHIVDEGVASHEDVDRAWMIVMGAPAGPFGIMDTIGLDVVRDIEMVYYNQSGDESDAPPRLLLEKVEKGDLGVKSGRGFYTYPQPAFEDPAWLRGGKEK
jgi:3-hydroxybutyryl-CoA dehydrogenase